MTLPQMRPQGRARPSYLRPIGPPSEADLARTRNDHPDLQDQRSSSSTLLPHPRPRPSLNPSDRRLARWLRSWAKQLTPKDRIHPVHDGDPAFGGAGFHGAEAFVLTFGRELILEGIHELTYWRPVDRLGRMWQRTWSDDIVSPARRLNALVRDLHELRGRQDQEAAR